jgi:3-hydroxyisobutyrate dehydrogenase-like beta-hydroxyacid dehydrogenase
MQSRRRVIPMSADSAQPSSSPAPLTTVGFIGIGQMGHGMLKNLCERGVPVLAFDPSSAALARAQALGAEIAPSPCAVGAKVKTVFLCVPSGEQVSSLLFGEDGLVSANNPSLMVVDHTTYNRNEAIAIAARAREAGLRYADCPVSGTPVRADNGTLTIMFGGQESDFLSAKPYLDITGEFVVHCGDVGSGQLMKAVNNIIYDVNIAAICEVIPLALKAGLDAEVLANVVTSGSSRSFASEYFVPKILDGQFDGDFSLQAAYKDIVNVQEAATGLAAMTPVVNAMIATYQGTIAQGLGDEAKSAMIKGYEEALGVQFRRDKSKDS